MRVRIFEAGLAAILDGPVDREVDRRAQQVLARADRYVPVDSGALRSTGRVRKPRPRVREVVYGGTDGVDYPLYVELGTSRMPAQPYLRPAIDGLPE